MAAQLVNLVKILSTSAGTGPFFLGNPVGGFRGKEALIDGATYSYTVQQGQTYEIGRGTYDAATNTIARDVLESSDGGDPVPFTPIIAIAFTLLVEDLPPRFGDFTGQDGKVAGYVNGEFVPVANNSADFAQEAAEAIAEVEGLIGQVGDVVAEAQGFSDASAASAAQSATSASNASASAGQAGTSAGNAAVDRVAAETAAAQAIAAAATPALYIQPNPATPQVPPAGVADGAQYWAVVGDTLTLYARSGASSSPVTPTVAVPLGSGSLSSLYAVIYGVDFAFETIADYLAAGLSPVNRRKVVIYGDPNPGNNVFYIGNGTVFVEQGPASMALYIRYRDNIDLIRTPNFETWRPRWNSGSPNDGNYGGLSLEIDTGGQSNYNPDASFFSVAMDGTIRYRVSNEMGGTAVRLYKNATTYVSMSNSEGVMRFGSGQTGAGPDYNLMSIGWESTPGDAVGIYYGGTGRVHHRSLGAIVQDSGNGRFEFEGQGSSRMSFVGYESATANGKPFDFNNNGQTTYPGVLVSMSTRPEQLTQKLLQFNTYQGSAWTERAFFDVNGAARFLASANVNMTIGAQAGTGILSFLTNNVERLRIAANGAISAFSDIDATGAVTGLAAINLQASAYTLSLADRGKVIEINSATPVNVTLPNSLPSGFPVVVTQAGAGQVTFVAASGATMRQADGLTKTLKQWSVVSLYVRSNVGGAAAEYVLAGAMA